MINKVIIDRTVGSFHIHHKNWVDGELPLGLTPLKYHVSASKTSPEAEEKTERITEKRKRTFWAAQSIHPLALVSMLIKTRPSTESGLASWRERGGAVRGTWTAVCGATTPKMSAIFWPWATGGAQKTALTENLERMYAPAPTPTPITVRKLTEEQNNFLINVRSCYVTETWHWNKTEVSPSDIKIIIVHSLEKLQDGRDHLCYGLHGGILVTAAGNTKDLRRQAEDNGSSSGLWPLTKRNI